MAGKFEAVMAYVEGGVAGVNGANALVDQFNSDKTGFVLVHQSLQTGAAVVSVLSITKLTAGFVPFLNVTTNTVAGTTTFLKIVAQYRGAAEGKDKFQTGDIISLVGNVAGVAASFLLLAGFAPLSMGFTAVAVTAAVTGLITSDTAKQIHDSVLVPLWERHFKDTPDAVYPDHFVSRDIRLVTRTAIDTDHGGKIALIRVDPETGNISMSSTDAPAATPEAGIETGAGGSMGGGAGRAFSGILNPSVNGDLPGVGQGAPMVTSAPPAADESFAPSNDLGINIEIIHDTPPSADPSPTPAAEPIPVPHPPPPPEAQDSYGCCTNAQDSYN
jgi:hypothetical protein